MHTPGKTAFIFLFGVTLAVRDVTIDAPSTVLTGQEITFYCHYNLEGELLYSVRWYLGKDEFFSYRPRHNPDTKIFPRKGLHVKSSHSNGSQVVLVNIQKHAAGQYSCEVSAEAPGFHTEVASTELQIIDGPKEHPKINGLESRYRLGQSLKANCSSPPSKPPVQLNWQMNGESKDAADWGSAEDMFGRSASWTLLFIPSLKEHHFRHGKIKVRCLASIQNAYWHVEEKSVEFSGIENERHKQRQKDQGKVIIEQETINSRTINTAVSQKVPSILVLASLLSNYLIRK